MLDFKVSVPTVMPTVPLVIEYKKNINGFQSSCVQNRSDILNISAKQKHNCERSTV